jgi:transcription elongation factor SPT5
MSLNRDTRFDDSEDEEDFNPPPADASDDENGDADEANNISRGNAANSKDGVDDDEGPKSKPRSAPVDESDEEEAPARRRRDRDEDDDEERDEDEEEDEQEAEDDEEDEDDEDDVQQVSVRIWTSPFDSHVLIHLHLGSS